jgi:formate/nitrite transporter FocA (FNT family)
MSDTPEEIKIPPSDQPKGVGQILGEQIQTGLNEFNRSNIGLFISALAAGMEIGFSVLLMGTIYTLFGGDFSAQTLHFCLALCYPLGFIFVIIGRSELFTEHTALAILPVLNRSIRVKDLMILWGLVYAGNLIGGYLFSFILAKIGPNVGFIENEAFEFLAVEMVHHDWLTIFYSALIAGWMMGLLGWLVTSSQETISRIFIIILVTATIGIAGLHHCIIGSIEVFLGFLTSENVTGADYLKFQVWASVGNALGGVVFVYFLKIIHAKLN